MDRTELVTLTADIVASHVSNNNVAISDMPVLVRRVHEALAGLSNPVPSSEPEPRQPIVSVRASVKPDSLTCLICGKKQKALRRHLGSAHDLTPDRYRAEFGLAPTYPMVAADYSKLRQELAVKIGLGRKSNAAPRRTRAKVAQ